MTKTVVIRIVSKKGGVGKTTIAINLAAALGSRGKKVLLDDGDIANSSASVQLGFAKKGVNVNEEVLYYEQTVKDALLKYEEGGFDILPGTGHTTYTTPPTEHQIRHLGMELSNLDYDFVIVDTAPGFFMPQIATYYKEVIIVSTAEEPSVVSAIDLAKMYDKLEVKHHLALNRLKNEDIQRIDDIEKLYRKSIFAAVPEDDIVSKSIKEHKPAYFLNKESKFSLAIEKLADEYTI